jgi:hypothetical protein
MRSRDVKLDFLDSRWFTRGWTLQELLAQPQVEFFSNDGFHLGDKWVLLVPIHEITGISKQSLTGEH